jgi:hypothetical protein
MSYTSASDGGSEDETGGGAPRKRLRSKASSPGSAVRGSKRKATTSSPHPSKKQKAADNDDDPMRKHCRDKFENIFLGIFLKYPFIDGEEKSADSEMSEEQTAVVSNNAKLFAFNLEQSMFAGFAEPDKNGYQQVAQKYK